ncbi:YdaU family protein [Microvirga zambiensis]|uniref:YdaU family protein n=1 Tax=Microvirga zambiensis TaxID=1402137 RepID=UPI00191E0ADE|nr:YdaU family protein [Microvirga zambiensis]
MSKRWYKRCGADFIHGTLGLTLEEKGAYSLCLDLIYEYGGPIADDARWLSGICGVSVRKWNAIRESLIKAGKLTLEDGRLMNIRAAAEIANSKLSSDNLAENGAKGGRKRAENERRSKENNDLGQAGLKHLDKIRKDNPPLPSFENLDEWLRGLVQDQPLMLALDTHEIKALIDDGITSADIEAGISAALKENFRARSWRQMVGWVRRAAQDRLAKAPKASAGQTASQPDAKQLDDGYRFMLRRFKEFPGTWPPKAGPRPGEPGCMIPAHILAEFNFHAARAA